MKNPNKKSRIGPKKAISHNYKQVEIFTLVLVFSFSIFWRIFGINKESLHVDEHIQAMLVSPSLVTTWGHSRFLGMPPLDMTFEWIAIQMFGTNNFAIRIFPTFFGAMSCVIFAVTIAKLSKLSIGILGGILAAVTPPLIFQQQTARPYALYIFLIMSIFYFATEVTRRARTCLILLLTALSWCRALEGPVSAVFISLLFLAIIFSREPVRLKAWNSGKVFCIPLVSAMFSVIWTKSTKNTIIGTPGNYLNSKAEIWDKILNTPEFIYGALKAILGLNFIFVNCLLVLLFLIVFLTRSSVKSTKVIDINAPLIRSLPIFVAWNFFNSLLIILVFYCLTKLQYFDRYFSLGILGWLAISVILIEYISRCKNKVVYFISLLIILFLAIQFTHASYNQAIKVDKIQFDQINAYIKSYELEDKDQVLVYQPGDLNQYLPGWPVSVGTTMDGTPSWIPYVVKRVYLDHEPNLLVEKNFSTLVLLPSVDARSNLLIGKPWESSLFDDSIPDSKTNYIPGGAYILKDLTKKEILRVLDKIVQNSSDSSNLWISSYALALGETSGKPASKVQVEAFCNYMKVNYEISPGTSFGLWGQPLILSSTVFQKAKGINCPNQ